MITLLIDADIVAFKFASAGQKTFKWPDGQVSVSLDPLEDVLSATKDYIEYLEERLGATSSTICLSCPSAEGFRKLVLPSYKDNRKDAVKPEYLVAVKEYLAANWKSYARPGLEADDVMGILSTHPTLIKGKKIIVSEDKDMQCVPGYLFNPAKDSKPRLITELEADLYHYTQTLTGDSVDGYKGCPGIGKVKAQKILDAAVDGRYWDAVVAAYVAKGLTEYDALVQARVARICRASDYDLKKKEVILWTPAEEELDAAA